MCYKETGDKVKFQADMGENVEDNRSCVRKEGRQKTELVKKVETTFASFPKRKWSPKLDVLSIHWEGGKHV